MPLMPHTDYDQTVGVERPAVSTWTRRYPAAMAGMMAKIN
jgi:hypothetical protein